MVTDPVREQRSNTSVRPLPMHLASLLSPEQVGTAVQPDAQLPSRGYGEKQRLAYRLFRSRR